uniref:Uncharacterized protein n=1 Tax=Plectus sambesii TaxID=2011161 RepID=A0A914WW99_9BILA
MGDMEALDAEMTEEEQQDDDSTLKSSPVLSGARSYDPDTDPELAEMLLSAVDVAANILRDGREIQKISVIRTLPDLLDGHGQECLDKVFPLVQEVLHVESTNLDMHCEGAVSFRNILANRVLCTAVPSIADEILKGILVNLNRQKDNLSAAAWLETLVDVVDHIPVDAVRYEVLPVVLSQADASQRVQRRVIASKLLEKLCSVLAPADVKADLAPCAQMLCQDSNANVRSAIGQRLPTIAKSLQSATDSVALILPCLIELCKDEDAGVREAILNTVGACMPYFDKESLQEIIVPLLRKCSEQSYRIGDETLTAVAKNLGSWCYNLRDVLSPADRAWFLSMYTRLAGVDDSQQQPANRARQGP